LGRGLKLDGSLWQGRSATCSWKTGSASWLESDGGGWTHGTWGLGGSTWRPDGSGGGGKLDRRRWRARSHGSTRSAERNGWCRRTRCATGCCRGRRRSTRNRRADRCGPRNSRRRNGGWGVSRLQCHTNRLFFQRDARCLLGRNLWLVFVIAHARAGFWMPYAGK
jgi:hypothetical protein